VEIITENSVDFGLNIMLTLPHDFLQVKYSFQPFDQNIVKNFSLSWACYILSILTLVEWITIYYYIMNKYYEYHYYVVLSAQFFLCFILG
jgi:hypothetical protein